MFFGKFFFIRCVDFILLIYEMDALLLQTKITGRFPVDENNTFYILIPGMGMRVKRS